MLNQLLLYKKWLLGVFLMAGLVFSATASPSLAVDAKPGDCVACHETQKVLPESHPPTQSMAYENCVACHATDGPNTLIGKMTGFHLHQLQGVGCVGCHGDVKKQEEVFHDQCMACHDTDKLVAATADTKPHNPHNSPHYGKDNDCTLCHRQHEKSENMCTQCHTFDFKVP